jgi:hypothetical protein
MLRWFRAAKVRGAVIGGVAVSLLSEPRYTRDIDATVVLDDKKWDAFLARAAEFGIRPRASDALVFARETRMLLLQHDISGIPLDISMGTLEFEQEMIDRALPIRVGRLTIPVATPEDLIILKAIAQRPQDLTDIATILDSQKDIDLARIHRLVASFALTLERPEISAELERLIEKRKKMSSKKKR